MRHRITTLLFLFCEFLFLFRIIFGGHSLYAQPDIFNGRVEVKSHDLLHDNNKSTIAGVLMTYTDMKRENFDTIYQTYHICGDTLVVEWRGMGSSVLYKSMSIGAFKYLLSSRPNSNYTRIPLNKNQSHIGSATADDWKSNKKRKVRSGFQYEYYLRNPDNKVVELFASVDESVVYRDQLNIGGTFENVFHHFGKFDTVVVYDGRTDIFMTYTYYEDPNYSCLEYFDAYPVRDLTKKEVDEVMTQLQGTESDTMIRTVDRKPFKVTGATALSNSSPADPSIADFQGKYLLVDVWASWCAPCRAEIPYLKELRTQYDEDKLALLSISLDREKDDSKWREAITSLQMNWPNWIIYDGFQSDFAQEYYIEAIPRYLIIDPEGKIVNDNAPRPSNEALKGLLNKLFSLTGEDDD